MAANCRLVCGMRKKLCLIFNEFDEFVRRLFAVCSPFVRRNWRTDGGSVKELCCGTKVVKCRSLQGTFREKGGFAISKKAGYFEVNPLGVASYFTLF
jgi:hypothetical protein